MFWSLVISAVAIVFLVDGQAGAAQVYVWDDGRGDAVARIAVRPDCN